MIHDGIATAVYGTVRAAHAAGPRATSAVIASVVPLDAPSVSDGRAGRLVLGAVNGMWGDTLVRRHPELGLDMQVRARGRAVQVDRDGIAAAFPNATPRLAIFVHGWCETDEWWLPRATDQRADFGSRLHRDLGYTPAYLRYNTGLRVSDNGRQLACLLDDLVNEWPVSVEEVALIGHSMGGLVLRSACHYGERAGNHWTPAVRHVVCLGTPHLGSHVERGVNVAGWALGRVAETRPFAAVVNARSVGVKDLRFGSCVEDDWRDHDPDELLRDRCTEVPFLERATYYFIGVTLTRDHRHPVASALGDLLVQYPSASGRGRRRSIPFEVDCGRHIGGLHHFDLLTHPAVYEQLRVWLACPSPSLSRP
jgi:pimeloyl-ACP methyl ester carboxylesterase